MPLPRSLEIQIRTLTPLWTGGIDGTCDRLHISGLMGSLRYWYEAIVRGAGGYACDPSQGGCVYDPKQDTKSICAACYLFGTTGWARLFRLTTDAQIERDFTVKKVNMSIGIDRRTGQNRRRDIPLGFLCRNDNSPLHFTMRLRPIPATMQISDQFVSDQVMMTLWFIHTFAGLGPKQQKGRGAVSIVVDDMKWASWNAQRFKTEVSHLQTLAEPQSPGRVFGPTPPPSSPPPEWPDLRQFFSIRADFSAKPDDVDAPRDRQENYLIKQESPMKISAIRYWAETYGKGPADKDLLFGTIRKEARASRICLDFHPHDSGYALHLFGFGVAQDRERDKRDLVGLLKEYIHTVKPAASSLREDWDGSLLPGFGGKA